MATAEAAFAILALVAVLVVCIAGLTAVSMQVRCIDAAREAARLAARGDDVSATAAAKRMAPDGAVVALRRDGDFVVARVSTRSAVLPGIVVAAEGVSAVEPADR
ncbi:TadE family type IV pilus minor pilin [Mycolicibacterium vaccae]|uniref:TadE family type IV pilus minor pilin n=2 Tax=Mycolicibacterium vaccae TaxID=1810 RepID=UPI001F2E4D03|nr:TadE family type IV pilus minor pilin [Mycolicibacterium vaccae]